ncbi:odorant receptor Or2-like [Schistocerca gregaria]|uniref:odorant receptor Or2-like n=1 Tax=Schistocerca gregaria TaxID=7010 RepID=UPI00211F0FC0|nr:odorant receptor Or2-like [Schistocerca gregaria]
MAPAPSAAAAAAAACDLDHLLRPLHWGAILRHPRSAATSPLLFRLRTLTVATFAVSFFCSEIVVISRQGTAELDVFILMLSVTDTIANWLFRVALTTLSERHFHKLALQVSQDFAEFATWDDVPLLRSQSRTVRRFTLGYICFGFCTCGYFLSLPCSDEGLPYILALPFDATQPVGFAFAFLYCTIVGAHTVVMSITLNAFSISLIAQLRMQLTLLNRKIANLAKAVPKKLKHSSDTSVGHDLPYRLKKCILHHQAIIKNVDLLQRCLGVMLLGQSVSIGSAACFQMYQIATRAEYGLLQMAKFGCYLIILLAELFIYCWFGDDLITESENVALMAYDAVTSLQESPLSVKKSLLLLMHRAQRPMCVTARGFFPFSRKSFVSVLRVSYSFFAILRNFQKEE